MSAIKKIRIQKGITQAEIADAMQVTVATVSRWETGEFFPRSAKLYQLAAFLGCSVDELLKN